MITEETINTVKSFSWVTKLERVNHNKFIITLSDGTQEICTARKINKYGQLIIQPNVKKLTKASDNSKNRAATRDALKTEEFDKIPQNSKVRQGDPWAWD